MRRILPSTQRSSIILVRTLECLKAFQVLTTRLLLAASVRSTRLLLGASVAQSQGKGSARGGPATAHGTTGHSRKATTRLLVAVRPMKTKVYAGCRFRRVVSTLECPRVPLALPARTSHLLWAAYVAQTVGKQRVHGGPATALGTTRHSREATTRRLVDVRPIKTKVKPRCPFRRVMSTLECPRPPWAFQVRTARLLLAASEAQSAWKRGAHGGLAAARGATGHSRVVITPFVPFWSSSGKPWIRHFSYHCCPNGGPQMLLLASWRP